MDFKASSDQEQIKAPQDLRPFLEQKLSHRVLIQSQCHEVELRDRWDVLRSDQIAKRSPKSQTANFLSLPDPFGQYCRFRDLQLLS